MGLSIRSFKSGKISNVGFDELKRGFDSKFVWVDAINPSVLEMRGLSEVFSFHEFSVESALSLSHHSRAEEFENYAFLPAFEVSLAEEKMVSRNISIFLGKNFIVTVHHGEILALKKVFSDYEKNPALFEKGPSFFLYNLFDQIVDDYFPQLDRVSEKIDALETEVFHKAQKQTISSLFKLKRKIISFRKIVGAEREVLNTLSRHETALMPKSHVVYFNDVFGHLLRVSDTVDIYRELISDSLEAYLTVISNRLNEIMKVLTIISTIVLPMTLITGFYGMNVEFLEYSAFGKTGTYFFAIGLMLAVGVIMLFWFRQKKWF